MSKKGKGTGKTSAPNATSGKRVRGSKKWSKLHEQSASTPVKPSGVKTPDKSRTSIETQTESKESKYRGIHGEKAHSGRRRDQLHSQRCQQMWKNQTWYNHQLIAMQRKEAALQYVFTGWTDLPNNCLSGGRQRQSHLVGIDASWGCAVRTGYQPSITNGQTESYISIVTYRNSWQRHRLASFMATLAKTSNGISYWAADGEVSSKGKIKGRRHTDLQPMTGS